MSIKVLDTYLRGLKRLERLTGEVAELQEEVAGREGLALRKILRVLEPVIGVVGGPISVREPWREGGEDPVYPAKGVVISRSFEQNVGEGGRQVHHEDVLAVVEGGRVVELTLRGSWLESGGRVTDTRWAVESREREVGGEFAAEHLRGVLTGILEGLRDALTRGKADRKALRRRLELLEEVDGLLG